MKKLLLFIFLLSISFSLFGQKIENNSKAFFYENKGQIVDQKGKENYKVKYLFNSPGLNVQIKNEGFSYDVYEVKRTLKKEKKQKKDAVSFKEQNLPEYDHNYQYHRIDIDFVNGNKHPEIIAKEKSADYDNYYNIPGKPEGVTEVHRFQKLIYKNLYSNIDLVFFKPDDTLKPVEYSFIVHPGGKISDIRLKFKGAKTSLKEGKISMNLRFGEMQENVPESWIEEPNGKKNIKINFKNISQDVYGFESSQDTFDNTVIIDPVPTRVWGTYFSGSYMIINQPLLLLIKMIRYTLAEKQQTQPILQLQEHTKRLCLMTLTTMDLFRNSRQTERESGEHILETYYIPPPYSMGL